VCEPTLVVKRGRGARATAAAAEAVAEQQKRWRSSQWNSTFDHQCKETKTIYKMGICEDGEQESDSKTYKLIMKTTKEMNFLRQHKREANVKRMNSANERQEHKEITKVVRCA